ncbi:MAG: ABC transporter substrate-binding protein [Burkholderiales bacterium]|nr:ABC transporter substrate-binding protein [Burkholderiales bacterium]
MKRLWRTGIIAGVALGLLATGVTSAQTLRVFSGGANQRPDLMRKLFDNYEKQNPGVKIEIETGGATSELQRQYLSTVLNAKDAAIDIYMIDIINPMQYARAGWLEPLNGYLGAEANTIMGTYLPAYGAANVVDGKIVALPAFADAQFLYYRKDLLDKYGVKAPGTWDELAVGLKKVLDGEKNPAVNGVATTGAAIEGAVCTFLKPYWSQGKEFNDATGRMTLDKAAAQKGLEMWLSLVDRGVMQKNIGEVRPADMVNAFKAGNLVAMVNWGFAWDQLQSQADSTVKGKVGVLPLPAMTGGKSATCIGGWQWAVSAFSKNKAASAKLVRYMSAPDSAKFLAIEGSLLPVFAQTYADADVLKKLPHYRDSLPVVQAAKGRPMSDRYGEVSDAIRTTTNAVLARTVKPADAVNDIEGKLRRVMR